MQTTIASYRKANKVNRSRLERFVIPARRRSNASDIIEIGGNREVISNCNV